MGSYVRVNVAQEIWVVVRDEFRRGGIGLILLFFRLYWSDDLLSATDLIGFRTNLEAWNIVLALFLLQRRRMRLLFPLLGIRVLLLDFIWWYQRGLLKRLLLSY